MPRRNAISCPRVHHSLTGNSCESRIQFGEEQFMSGLKRPAVYLVILLVMECLVTGNTALRAQTLDDNALKGMKWRQVGPFRGGRALAVTGVAGDPETYYFGAVAGGVWKTANGGLTWAPLTEARLGCSSVSRIRSTSLRSWCIRRILT